ncbi:hypothetical protein LAZ67_13000279 [Cordylochernes scorpioides]|uniref:DNA helicase Pif1-like 2B domain-containing protein n=1 Tax=Cordylochernes scorpioides TaxID=51811 RepID=A0ABY6L2T4_9ARAC|nr:hypothetical protein LAZ67_13000279 [Cordylochernes scorpioides]
MVDPDESVSYPPEFLNSLELSGTPSHKIVLKVGVPIILIRNLDPPRLCNGTRLCITRMGTNVLQARILTGIFRVWFGVNASKTSKFEIDGSHKQHLKIDWKLSRRRQFRMSSDDPHSSHLVKCKTPFLRKDRSEKVQRWKNKPTIPTKRPSNLSPKIYIYGRNDAPRDLRRPTYTDRQRQEQAEHPNDTVEIPASHGNRRA